MDGLDRINICFPGEHVEQQLARPPEIHPCWFAPFVGVSHASCSGDRPTGRFRLTMPTVPCECDLDPAPGIIKARAALRVRRIKKEIGDGKGCLVLSSALWFWTIEVHSNPSPTV